MCVYVCVDSLMGFLNIIVKNVCVCMCVCVYLCLCLCLVSVVCMCVCMHVCVTYCATGNSCTSVFGIFYKSVCAVIADVLSYKRRRWRWMCIQEDWVRIYSSYFHCIASYFHEEILPFIYTEAKYKELTK
jgi:hypothetical protein